MVDQQSDEAELYDRVLSTARAAGIDAASIELIPPSDRSSAWVVREIDRSWPTQVDTVAINPRTMVVTDQLVFDDFPFAAKLTRWGIDAHMGILFGLPNQLFVAACALALCVLVALGYRMWWIRRPVAHKAYQGDPRRISTYLRRASATSLVAMLLVMVALGVFAPVMGVSLLVFLLIDLGLSYRRHFAEALAAE